MAIVVANTVVGKCSRGLPGRRAGEERALERSAAEREPGVGRQLHTMRLGKRALLVDHGGARLAAISTPRTSGA
jgi:hypothetical protein